MKKGDTKLKRISNPPLPPFCTHTYVQFPKPVQNVIKRLKKVGVLHNDIILMLDRFDVKTIAYALKYYEIQKEDVDDLKDWINKCCQRVYEKRQMRKNKECAKKII